MTPTRTHATPRPTFAEQAEINAHCEYTRSAWSRWKSRNLVEFHESVRENERERIGNVIAIVVIICAFLCIAGLWWVLPIAKGGLGE